MARWVMAVVLVGASLFMSPLPQPTQVSRMSRPAMRDDPAICVASPSATRVVGSKERGQGIQRPDSGPANGRGEEWAGLASWCGGGERLNRHTAMGRRFHPKSFEAAMWDVPLGALVRVTNRDTGRSIVARVTDRGPARRLRKTRVIDLTRGAFAQLAPLRQGLVPVTVQRLRSVSGQWPVVSDRPGVRPACR